MLFSPPWIYYFICYLGRPILKYWQHTIGLVCLCQRHMICTPHALAKSISAKHLGNTLHLRDRHRANTKISSRAGHEYVQKSKSPLFSKQSCGFPLHPMSSRSNRPWDWTQPADLQEDDAPESRAVDPPALLPRAIGRARQPSILASLTRWWRGSISGAGGSRSSAEAGAKFCWF